MYEYRARLVDVHDGDTVHVAADLGFDLVEKLTLRLMGINAPELAAAGGTAARDHLTVLLGDGNLVIRTVKDHREKYGRYLAYLWNAGEGSFGPNAFNSSTPSINDRMVADGFAVVYLP